MSWSIFYFHCCIAGLWEILLPWLVLLLSLIKQTFLYHLAKGMLFEQDISYTHKFYDMRGLKAKRLFDSRLPQLAWYKRLCCCCCMNWRILVQFTEKCCRDLICCNINDWVRVDHLAYVRWGSEFQHNGCSTISYLYQHICCSNLSSCILYFKIEDCHGNTKEFHPIDGVVAANNPVQYLSVIMHHTSFMTQGWYIICTSMCKILQSVNMVCDSEIKIITELFKEI